MSEPLRYWLLTGEVPSGPFTVAEIHAKLAAQEATWETPACAVGGSTWLPLLRTAGVGPAAVPSGDTPQPRSASNRPASPPNAAPPPPLVPARRPDEPVPSEQPAGPPRAGAKRVLESLGGVLVLLILGGILWRANCTGGDGGRDTASAVPAEYRPYMRDGKIVPTGHPTLDHWVHVNVLLTTIPAVQNDLTLPRIVRDLAKHFRERPTAGVDPDLVRWVAAVASLLETRADIVERLNDPATLRHAREEVAAGRPNPLDAAERAVTDWERERDRLRAEGKSLQDALSRRHARPFPPPQLRPDPAV